MRDVQANPCESGRIFINLIILLFFLVFSAVLYLARRPFFASQRNHGLSRILSTKQTRSSY